MGIPDNWSLPEKIVARLGVHTAGRQRSICEDGHLLMVLHEPPGPDRSRRKAVYFWREPGGRWHSSARGSGIQCLRDHIQRFHDVEDRLDAKYRGARTARDFFRLLEDLVPLCRCSRNLASALQSARDAVQGDRQLIEIRDESGELERAFALLYQDVCNAMEFDAAKTAAEQNRLAEQTARAGHRLNIMAALFFPLTAVASVFGMNMRLGVEEAPIWISWIAVGCAFVVGAAMLYWVTGGNGRR